MSTGLSATDYYPPKKINFEAQTAFYLSLEHWRRICCLVTYTDRTYCSVESSWNVMAHGNAREGKWRWNWRMEWVDSTLHTTSEHGVSNITTADTHTSAASSRLNWRSRRFKWTRPFRRKMKSGFCACAITFETQSAMYMNFCFFFPKTGQHL